jgi:hypothetical protein
MGKHCAIALYGNSLIVSSIGANLINRPGLTLHQLDASTSDLAEYIKREHPDVLIFDLATDYPVSPIALLKEHPRLLLIGIDISNAKMLVLSGQQAQALTIDDLTHVIEAQIASENISHPSSNPHGGTHVQ